MSEGESTTNECAYMHIHLWLIHPHSCNVVFPALSDLLQALKTKRVLVLTFVCLFVVALLSLLTRSPSEGRPHRRSPLQRDGTALEHNSNHVQIKEDEYNHDDSNPGDGSHGEVPISSKHGKVTLTVEVTPADRGILHSVEVKGVNAWRELSEVSLSLLHSLRKHIMSVCLKGECHVCRVDGGARLG